MAQSAGKTPWTIIIPILVAIITCIATIFAALISRFPDIVAFIKSTPVQTLPPPSCITADEIIVKFDVLRNEVVIDTLRHGGSFSIEPGMTVDFQVKIEATGSEPLPPLEYAWTNNDIPTGGKLLNDVGYKVGYKSGLEIVADGVSLQVSQPSCPALPPYSFLILPNP